jgi:glc operon protein GlcG
MKIFFSAGSLTLLLILATAGESARAAASEAPAPSPNPVVSSSSLPLTEARVIIEGAVAYARNAKMRMSVVVLDDGGHLISADRMDGTSFNSEHQPRAKRLLQSFHDNPAPRWPN